MRSRARPILTSSALALLAVALALVLPALSSGAGIERTMTIRLLSTTASARTVDIAPKREPNKGDAVFVRSVLRNGVAQFGRRKGAVVGNDYAISTLLSARVALVKATVWLPGGTLRVRGKIDFTRAGGSLPVVGGTGRFKDAHGTCQVQDRRYDSINVYHLRVPPATA